jgi:hypothetical protein
LKTGKLSARLVLPIVLCCGVLASAPAPAGAGHGPPQGDLTRGRPVGRLDMALAYDTDRHELVMFGGFSSVGDRGIYFGDTWTWDGVTWTRHRTAASPPRMYGARMVYDQARHEAVLFGGTNDRLSSDQTWAWDGADWTRRRPANSPPPEFSSPMVYDPVLEEVILLQGTDSGPVTTWTWDGTNWSEEESPVQPGPRLNAAGAFDESNGTFVVFGGSWACGDVPCPLGDTWTWNGDTWTEQHPEDDPGKRSGPVAAYDASSEMVVLFGGGTLEETRDTATWDGTNWTWRHPPRSPPGRGSAGMVFDTALEMVVLFGGGIVVDGQHNYFNDLWAWDGTTWHRIG